MTRLKHKLSKIILIIIIIPLGLLSKQYHGLGASWINDFSGDILYEVFWCLFLSLFFVPSRQVILKIAMSVFIITCIIEISQLWQTGFLIWIRSHTIGKLLLGTTFSWLDFPHYLLGCVLGWLLLIKFTPSVYEKTN